MIPRTVTGADAMLDRMRRDIDTGTAARLADIARTAEVIKRTFWDHLPTREEALDVSLFAKAALKRKR
jgi:hypothetical protein